MPAPNPVRLRNLVKRAIGPAPWYWETFPKITSATGQNLTWIHHGSEGTLGYLVSLHAENGNDPLLALNTYCRPFLVPPSYLGIWCPEGRSLRLMCFDPAQLKSFDFAEIAGWFKQSSERIYAATAPVAEFEIPLSLAPGTHQIEVPQELQTVDELIAPTSYPAKQADDPAFAIYVIYPHAGLVEVLPQRWFTASQYQVGRQWIPRATRDPESHQIGGECFGVGIFALEEDGQHLQQWMERSDS